MAKQELSPAEKEQDKFEIGYADPKAEGGFNVLATVESEDDAVQTLSAAPETASNRGKLTIRQGDNIRHDLVEQALTVRAINKTPERDKFLKEKGWDK